jgi:hypothetical protein
MSEDAIRELGIVNPQMAIAVNLGKLTDPEFIYALSIIRNEKQRQALMLCFSIGKRLGYTWLVEDAKRRLQLAVSNRKARGRDGLEKTLQSQVTQERRRIGDRVRDFVEGRTTQ